MASAIAIARHVATQANSKRHSKIVADTDTDNYLLTLRTRPHQRRRASSSYPHAEHEAPNRHPQPATRVMHRLSTNTSTSRIHNHRREYPQMATWRVHILIHCDDPHATDDDATDYANELAGPPEWGAYWATEVEAVEQMGDEFP